MNGRSKMRRAPMLVLIGWALPLAIAPRGRSGGYPGRESDRWSIGPGGAGERIDSLMEPRRFSGCVFVYRDGLGLVLHRPYGPTYRAAVSRVGRNPLPRRFDGERVPPGGDPETRVDGRLTIDDAVLERSTKRAGRAQARVERSAWRRSSRELPASPARYIY